LLLLVSTATVFAQTETEDEQGEEVVAEEDEKNKIVSSPDLVVYSIFPNANGKEFESGSPVEVVVGLHNIGQSTFSVNQVFASLRHPYDWRVAIQNFTRFDPRITIAPGDQVSVGYSFLPDPNLDTERPFVFAAQVIYTDASATNFTTFFHNDTITMVSPPGTVDIQLIFTYTGLLAVAGLLAFLAVRFFAPKKRGGVTRSPSNARADKEEWLKGTAASTFSKKRT